MRVVGDGMLRVRTRVVCLLVLATIAHSYALPLQYLPEIPGYIPVYIRYGDQPLDEVHPGLREAFHEPNDDKILLQVQFDQAADEEHKGTQPIYYKPESHLKTVNINRKGNSEHESSISVDDTSTKHDASTSTLPRVKLERIETVRFGTPILPDIDPKVFENHDEQISHNSIGASTSNSDQLTK